MKSAENCLQNTVSVRIPDCDIEENGSLRNSLSKMEGSVAAVCKEHFHQVDGEKIDQRFRLNFPHFDL